MPARQRRCRRARAWARRSSWITAATASSAWCWRRRPARRHVAIVARSSALPLVGSLEGIADNAARSATPSSVDGEDRRGAFAPAAEVVEGVSRPSAHCIAQRVGPFCRGARPARRHPRRRRMSRLMMNAGLQLDMPHIAESGADGIGLFRTELQFMIGETMPRLNDQIGVLRPGHGCGGRQAGGVPHARSRRRQGVCRMARWEREENPALGWRAIRIALDRPALLRYQVRALIAAATDGTLRLLLPMVSDVAEFERRARSDRPRAGARPARPGRRHPSARWAPCWRCRRCSSCCRS